MKRIWVLVAAIVVCGGLLAATMAWSAGQTSSAKAAQQAAYADMQSAASDLETDVDKAGDDARNDEVDGIRSATGQDLDRIDADTDAIRTMLSTALTWDSGAAYDAARQALIDKGVPETSQALTTYMPRQTCPESGGRTYCHIDVANLASEQTGAVSVVAKSATAGTYVYAVTTSVKTGTKGDDSCRPVTTTGDDATDSTDGTDSTAVCSAMKTVPVYAEATTDSTGHVSDLSIWSSAYDLTSSLS